MRVCTTPYSVGGRLLPHSSLIPSLNQSGLMRNNILESAGHPGATTMGMKFRTLRAKCYGFAAIWDLIFHSGATCVCSCSMLLVLRLDVPKSIISGSKRPQLLACWLIKEGLPSFNIVSRKLEVRAFIL